MERTCACRDVAFRFAFSSSDFRGDVVPARGGLWGNRREASLSQTMRGSPQEDAQQDVAEL
jgi:hypothetical protein